MDGMERTGTTTNRATGTPRTSASPPLPEGAIPASDGDLPVRHFGDPALEYEAATGGVAVLDRSRRGQVVLTGRQPPRMMSGIATGTIPDHAPDGRGRMPASLVLTPKGRPLASLRIARLEPGEAGALLLDTPAAALAPLLEHFRRSLPPLFARPHDQPAERGVLTLVGPHAARALTRALEELADEGLVDPAGGEGTAPLPDADTLEGTREGDEVVLAVGPDPAASSPDDGPDPGVRIVRQGDVWPLALDVLGPRPLLDRLRREVEAAGGVPAGRAVWDTLRVEHGRPAFGVDVDEGVLPPEAGLVARTIDHGKGCYTGQEVIVRIRDRGKVNRHLRGLLLGDAPAPRRGTELFVPGKDRSVGEVRSVVQSPRFGQGIALAYVRREVEPGGEVRVGAPDGPSAGVRALSDGGWVEGASTGAGT